MRRLFTVACRPARNNGQTAPAKMPKRYLQTRLNVKEDRGDATVKSVPHAAHAASAHYVNLINDVLNARHTPHRFLNQLLQVKAGQTAREEQISPFLLDFNAVSASAKMRVTIQLLPR
jgi:hypothetical protein